MNSTDLVAEMEAARQAKVKVPCPVCALPEPYGKAVNDVLLKGTASIPVILAMLEKYGQPKVGEKRLKRHRAECIKRG